MRKEREASNGFREREERQNAVAIPVRCRVSRIFPGSPMMKIRTEISCVSPRYESPKLWIFGRAEFRSDRRTGIRFCPRSIFPTIVEECYNYGADIFCSVST